MKTTKKTSNNFPDWVLEKWQEIADLLAETIGVPAALIMKTENESLEVFISSHTENNPYPVGTKEKWHGLYCETVIKTQNKLLVPDATKDKVWDKNPDIRLGMIAYLGFPLNFPDNQPFGTLCVLDNKERPFTLQNEKLIQQFKNVIELDLALLQSFEFKSSRLTANVVQEITERKQTEETLRQSKDFMNSIIEKSPTSLWISDEHGTLIRMNQACRDILHLQDKEVVGKYNLFNDNIIEEQGFMPLVREVFEKGANVHFVISYDTGAVEGLELGMTKRFNLDVSISPISDQQGKVINAIIQHIDVSQRKLAEENIKKLNRVYTVLSNINQTIVRIHDKQELFDKACSIAVDDGGFMMVWIGIVNPATNKVDVVASAGNIGEYLQDINIDLNDLQRSSGPTGRAIKSGKSEFSNNIETDDKMIPWSKKAIMQGYRSSITLPIFLTGQIIGAYTMYSGETDFFNEEEIKLLEEMASDISFALEFIDSEKKRELAEEELKASEEKFRNVFEAANVGKSITSPNGKIHVNNAFCEMLGYTMEELQHKSWQDITPSDEIETIQKEINRLLNGELNATRFNKRYIHKNGSHIWADVSVAIQRDNLGMPKHFITTVINISERIRAEDAFRISEQKYRNIFDHAPLGIFQTTPEGKFLSANAALANMLGYSSPEEMISLVTNIADQHYEEPPIRNKEMNTALDEGRFVLLENVYRRVNGTTWDGRSFSRVIHDELGKPMYYEGFVEDISDSKRAEEALQENNSRLELAMQSANMAWWEMDIAMGKVVFDQRKSEMLGYPAGNFKHYKDFMALVHPEDSEKAMMAMQKHIDGESNKYEVEYRILTQSGGYKWFYDIGAIVKKDSHGIPLNATGLVIDITERKRAEEKIREKDIQFRKLSANVSDLIFQFTRRPDGSYYVPIASEGIRNIFGCSPEDVLDDFTPIGRVIYPDDAARVISDIEYSAEHLTYFTCEFRVQIPGKEIQWIFSRSSPEKLPDGSITWYGFNADITDHKRAEQELIKAKEKAEESDKLKSAFLTNMSHEIRTPMNGILGFAELLKEPKLSGEEQQEYIRVIEKSGARMLNIINDIVSISKIESGTIDIHISETNMNEQTEYVYDLLRLDAEKKNLILTINNGLPDKESFIKTDSEKFFSILSNLVKNAIKYTDQGSIEFGYILKADGEPVELEFYIKDTGIGIPKDRQKAVFERFIQADIVDKMARQGAGLGLAISKAYVVMLGGRIWVTSEIGKGSTFYFTVPFRVESKHKIISINDTSAVIETHIKNLKILIAEDDETSERLMSISVKTLSREILRVRSGADAIKACRNNPDIDLILMDIQMNDLNGYEATRQIRQFNKEVIIIAQTAFAQSGDREKSIVAGCNDYIAKPINKDELLVLIQKYFKK